MVFSSTTLLLCAASLALLSAAPASAINHMLSGDTLKSGNFLLVEDDSFSFVMQDDCNLVLYHQLSVPIWASHTVRKSTGCYLTLQRDGNLVIFDSEQKAIWKSNTIGRDDGEYILILQKNGVVALYGLPVWKIDAVPEGFIIAAGNATDAAGSSSAAGAEVWGRKAKLVRILSATGDD